PIGPDFVELVESNECGRVKRRFNTGAIQRCREQLAVIQLDREVIESELLEDFADRRKHFRLDNGRSRSNGIDVALVELAKAAARGPVGAPHWLNLVSLEVLRQRAATLGHD